MKCTLLQKMLLLLFTGLSSMLFAQISVSGTVTDENGPIPGINVVLQGTGQGAVTDFNGKYVINDVPSDGVLIFSYIGFTTLEMPVGGRSVIDVQLEVESSQLEQVVVIGYGTQSKRDVTGSVASVQADDFNVGVISSPEQLIQGKTAGVQITQTSGEPGAGVNLRIRGTSSVRANNNPLFVLDGFPLNGADTSAGTGGTDLGGSAAKNPLNFLSPNDIESIDVLKDASASAIYGSRAANGVVLITTKKARPGKFILDFSTSVSTARVGNRIELLDRQGYLQAQESLGANINSAFLPPGDPQGEPGIDFGVDTDWQDIIFRDALTSNFNASFGQGTERGRYRFSLSFMDQEGVVENSGQERLTALLNVQQRYFDDKVKINGQLLISDVDDERAPIADNSQSARGDLLAAAYYSNPTLAPYDANGIPTLTGSTEQFNPAALLFYSKDETSTLRSFTNISAEYEFLYGLSFKTVLGLDKSASTRAAGYSPDLEVQGIQGLGRAQIDDLNLTTTLWENYFTFNKEIGKSRMDFLLGYSYQKFESESKLTLAAGFRDDIRTPDFMLNNLASARVFGSNTNKTQDELQSFYGRANYIYNDKYFLTATFRADGSTRFGENNKYGYFPSFAFAWRLSDEDFIPDMFSNLKLRLGYGILGNQEFGTNRYRAARRYTDPVITNGGALEPGQVLDVAFSNSNLKWEETSQFNAGLDFGFWNNRIYGTIDVYRKNTTDLLFQVFSAQPAPNDFNFQNLDAELINQGIEFGININSFDTKDFYWDTAFNIAFNENEVTNFEGGSVNTGRIDGSGLTQAFAQRIEDGQPLYAYYLREFLGFDPVTGFEQYAEGGQKFTGDSPLPTTNLGLTNYFRYKNFDLSVFLTGQFGHHIYNNTANALFTVPTLNQGRNVPVETAALIGTESVSNSADVSTRFLEKGDFLRLQNATLGFNFNMNNVDVIQKLRLFANAQNLLVITDYSGQDPEVSINKQINGVPSIGIDYTAYPRPRTFSLGLDVVF